MLRDVLFVGSTNAVRIRKLTNILTGELLTGAAVAVILLDEAAAQVVGETWPRMAAYDAVSGEYVATLSSALEIVDGQQVTLQVTATQGQIVRRWDLPLLCLTSANDQH